MEDEALNELGDELRRLRREHRIGSQDELATLSGVSSTTIKKLESGAIRESRPSTLMLLARGLATDIDGKVDTERTEAVYTRLMRAAGFLPRERTSEGTSPISRAAFIADMEKRTGRKDLALAMSTVAWDYDEIPEGHRKILEAAILGLAGSLNEDENEKT